MEAQQTKMDVIAHNLANTNTTGFKKSRAEFEDLLSETIRSSGPPTAQGGGNQPSALQVGLGVRTIATTRSFESGDMVATNNPLDVAIEGTGFLTAQEAERRDGLYPRRQSARRRHRPHLHPARRVDRTGITVPQETTALTIRPDGTVLATCRARSSPD